MLESIEEWIAELEHEAELDQEGGDGRSRAMDMADKILRENYPNLPARTQIRMAPFGSGVQGQKTLKSLYKTAAEKMGIDLAIGEVTVVKHNQIISTIIANAKAIYEGQTKHKIPGSLKNILAIIEPLKDASTYKRNRGDAMEPLEPSAAVIDAMSNLATVDKPIIKSTYKYYRSEWPTFDENRKLTHRYALDDITMDYKGEKKGFFPDEVDIKTLVSKKPYKHGGIPLDKLKDAIVKKGSQADWLPRRDGARKINEKWTSLLSDLAMGQPAISAEISAGNTGKKLFVY